MTRRSTKQRGISLVEVVLTLGISSLLLATILTGRNSVRSNAQFSDGVERIKEQILLTKSDASTGNNKLGDGASAGGGANAYLLLGESIRFRTTADTTMQISNIMCRTDMSTFCGEKVTTSISSRKDLAIPWRIKYLGYTTSATPMLTGGDLTLTFAREDKTANFTGSWYPGELRIGSADKLADVFANKTPITLHFVSTDGRKAIIEVNPITGSVTRTIQ